MMDQERETDGEVERNRKKKKEVMQLRGEKRGKTRRREYRVRPQQRPDRNQRKATRRGME